MLEFLKGIFKKDCQLFHISLITGNIAEIISTFEEDYMHDPKEKNAAIDVVIKMLEEHKETI